MTTMTPWDRARARRFAAALDCSATADPGLASLMQIVAALRVAGRAIVAPSEDFRWALRSRLVSAT